MRSRGGYFELELEEKKNYHEGALMLNSGRNAFEYILRTKNYRKVYLPYFTCDVMLLPLNRLNIIYHYYHINKEFEPLFNYNEIKNDEAFVYTNYFGLKDNFIKNLSGKCKNLIVDNAQAFFSKPIESIDTFYSPRKFFGVPDGAFLYTNQFIHEELEEDKSYNRFEHLLRRIDNGAEDGYSYFINNEKFLNEAPLRKMSKLTFRILKSINYDMIANVRVNNYKLIHQSLGELNKLKIKLEKDQIPFSYPFYTDKKGLREKLIKNNFYVAQYWEYVKEVVSSDSLESVYVNNIVHLPIDQRFSSDDLKTLISIIINE